MGGLVDPRVSFEGATAPLPFASVMLPFRGEELSQWLGEWDRVGQLGFMIRDPNAGSVLRSPDGRPVIRYHIGDELHALTLRSLSMLAEILLRGGAEEVALGVRGLPPVRTLDEARALPARGIGRRDVPLIGFHPLGTCAVGTSPHTGVVDQDNQVFGWDGLYVVDGASVPSSLGVNPQITIMAMALRAADGMAATLGA
jgi:choline dehydrogenase-like flavoprotein